MKKIIGITNKDERVYTSEEAPNGNILIVGKSGTRKSSMATSLTIQSANRGEPTIVFNMHNSLNRKTMCPELREEYEKLVKVIDVEKDGIPLSVFSQLEDKEGNIEKDRNVIERVTSLLTIAADLPPTQEAIVYEAVEDVFYKGLYETEGIAVISDWLRQQDKALAKNASSKLRSICESNIFYNGDFWEEGTYLYEFDLNGLEYDVQLKIIKFLLEYFLRLANKERFLEKGLNIFVDEAQNLDYSESSTMFTMLNESRKLNVRLILVAPSILSSVKKGMEVTTQCGVCLYYAPLDKDRRKVAEMLDAKKSNVMMFMLSRLQKGECIISGKYKLNGEHMSTPKIIRNIIPKI